MTETTDVASRNEDARASRRKWIVLGCSSAVISLVVIVIVVTWFLVRVNSGLIATYDFGFPMEAYILDNDGEFPPVLTDKPSPRFDSEKMAVYRVARNERERKKLLENESDLETKLVPDIRTYEAHFDEKFYYVGYVVTNLKEAKTFAEVYNEHRISGEQMEGDIVVPDGAGNLGSDILFQLRDGLHSHIAETLAIDESEVRDKVGNPAWLIERPVQLGILREFITTTGTYHYKPIRVERGDWPNVVEFDEILRSLEVETASQ